MQGEWSIVLSILESADASSVGRQKVFTRSPLTIGRSENNDMVILDPSISRSHAVIKVTDDPTRVFLNDVSTFGTEVSGKKIPKGPGSGFTLSGSETIKIGDTIMRYEFKQQMNSQATFIGQMDRSFLDSSSPPFIPKTPPSPQAQPVQSEPPPENEHFPPLNDQEEEFIDEEFITEEKSFSPLYISVIILCLAAIIYLAFFT